MKIVLISGLSGSGKSVALKQLEDLGFRHQEPEKYREIALLLDEKRTERLEYIENFLNILRTELKKYNIHLDNLQQTPS